MEKQISLIISFIRSWSISFLIKLTSSSENLRDLALCCIFGASKNSILSPEIIDKMFGSFVSFLHCLTCFSSLSTLKLLVLLNSKDFKTYILLCVIVSGIFALAFKIPDLNLIDLSLKKSFVCGILCFQHNFYFWNNCLCLLVWNQIY